MTLKKGIEKVLNNQYVIDTSSVLKTSKEEAETSNAAKHAGCLNHSSKNNGKSRR